MENKVITINIVTCFSESKLLC